MNRATRAIIMAAGRGERMKPLTDTIPKPLVKVRGTRMIDTILSALRENGIREIYVVVGYLAEAFAGLPAQYPGLQLIYNPDYATANNIASLYYAREHLGDCIILDGDQIILDPAILNPEFDRSCYCCRRTDTPTKEWLLTVDHSGTVTHCSRTGGEAGWALHSVSFWSSEDGRMLRKHLELEYMEWNNRGVYWDDVALNCHQSDYSLGIRPIDEGALMEIDSLEELIAWDPSYGDANERSVNAKQ